MKGRLYVIPTFIAESASSSVFPSGNLEIIAGLRYFVVEHAKTFRSFLKAVHPTVDFNEIHVFENHSQAEFSVGEVMVLLNEGIDVGLVSDAGCPGIADPGSELVKRVHKSNGIVIPLIGPSSIYLALMASGLNGQSFKFNGYLPIKSHELKPHLKQLEMESSQNQQTQICIETPYRNNAVFQSFIQYLLPTTMLCIAMDITGNQEYIHTKSIEDWRKMTDLHLPKNPTIFLFQSI